MDVGGYKMRNLIQRGSSYIVVATDPNGKRVWKSIGAIADWKKLKPRDLVKKVHETVEAVKRGKSLDGPETFERVTSDFMSRYVEEKGLRTAKAIRRNLTNHVLPVWGARDFTSIQRNDIAKLLDKIQDNAGPVMADKVLGHVSKICRWYATRHHDYVSPIVPGMNRTSTKDRARTRILNDDELRAIWKVTETNGVAGAFIRMALLTGQRAGKLVTMKWDDLKEGVWCIPQAPREKGNAGDLVLPKEALAVLDSLPRFASCPYVFTLGRTPIGDDYIKKSIDAKVKTEQPWVLHDLRRTSKSLMARAGVRPDISERVLGHVIQGVEGIYDRHEYRDEKAHALRALAGLIESILAPQDAKVRQLRGYSGN
jgi:integrase